MKQPPQIIDDVRRFHPVNSERIGNPRYDEPCSKV